MKVPNQIFVHGWKSEGYVFDMMSKADILPVPSVSGMSGDQEATPLVIQESLAIGTPVIASDQGGISELIKDGKTGFLVPEKNISAFIDKINYIISHPNEVHEIRIKGRATVEEKFNLEAQNDRIVHIYNQLLAQKSI